jgi:AcrR family transcriptional regulator
MPRKKKTAQAREKTLHSALFDLIASKGWVDLTLPQIARGLKIPLAELIKTYPDKNALLRDFLAHIDQSLAAGASIEDGTPKERLFEVMMLRFEAMQPYRNGVVRLLDEAFMHPLYGVCLAVEMAPQARRSARLMMELAEFSLPKPLSELAIGGMKLVYLNALRAWKKDTSADLSATMASLDRGIDRLISVLRLPNAA